MSDIRIMIVDDHSLFREGLNRMLSSTSGFQVVGEYSGVQEAVAAISLFHADVVLLDYDLESSPSEEVLRVARQVQKHARVLFVTAGMPPEAVARMMETGASGVFLKHNNMDRLLSAIERVASGEVWMDSATPRISAGTQTERSVTEPARPLTARQNDVLRGILDGLTNKEIAARLSCSESSVKAVIQDLFHKAGVRTRSQLVRIAIEKHASDWFRSSPVA